MGRVLHVSSNGDRWVLLRDPTDGRSLVRHQANAASGGHGTDIASAAFLIADCGGPEHQALWTLIATLTEGAPTPATAVG